MFIKSVLPLVITSLSIASTQFFIPNAVFGQQKNNEASTIWGTWRAITGSGDYVYGAEDFPVKKVGGVTGGTINYDIHTHGKRTLRANQAASDITPLNSDGTRLVGGKTRGFNVVQKYHGVIQGDSLYFTEDNNIGIQKWLSVPGNKFDVIVLHSGKYPSASQYTVEQTAKRTCK